MNAIIKTQNGFYCSTVFAYHRGKKWGESTVVVFNQSNSQLDVVHCHYVDADKHIHLTVLFADDNKDNWVKSGDWEGLDFIVDNKDLLKSISAGDNIPLDILNKCKALQTTETFSGWNTLETEDDIRKLMNICLDFHDGYIESIEVDGNDTYVKFKCWSIHVTIKFTNLLESEICEETPWEYTSIADAIMRFDECNIEWYVDGFNCCAGDDPDPQCYFIAERAQYKIEFD